MTDPPRIPSRCSECGAPVELALAEDFHRGGVFVGKFTAWLDPDTQRPHACLRFVRADTRAAS